MNARHAGRGLRRPAIRPDLGHRSIRGRNFQSPSDFDGERTVRNALPTPREASRSAGPAGPAVCLPAACRHADQTGRRPPSEEIHVRPRPLAPTRRQRRGHATAARRAPNPLPVVPPPDFRNPPISQPCWGAPSTARTGARLVERQAVPALRGRGALAAGLPRQLQARGSGRTRGKRANRDWIVRCCNEPRGTHLRECADSPRDASPVVRNSAEPTERSAVAANRGP